MAPTMLAPVEIDEHLSYKQLQDLDARAKMIEWIRRQPADAYVYKGLLGSAQWNESVEHIQERNQEIDSACAERSLNEALALLLASAMAGEMLVLSKLADIGLDDGLIPFTRLFRELGWRLLGPDRFFDHAPFESDVSRETRQEGLDHTIRIMQKLGLRFYPTAWTTPGSCGCGGAYCPCK